MDASHDGRSGRGPLTGRHGQIAQALTCLGPLVAQARIREGMSVRAVGREVGVSFSTIQRIMHGEDCNLSVAIMVLQWLDRVEQNNLATNQKLSDIRHSERKAS